MAFPITLCLGCILWLYSRIGIYFLKKLTLQIIFFTLAGGLRKRISTYKQSLLTSEKKRKSGRSRERRISACGLLKNEWFFLVPFRHGIFYILYQISPDIGPWWFEGASVCIVVWLLPVWLSPCLKEVQWHVFTVYTIGLGGSGLLRVVAKGKSDLHLDFLLGVANANANGKICNSGTLILNVNTSICNRLDWAW